MEISYKLEHFEGPLDLLLHLIEKNKVNIYDIPIVEITSQYLDYVNRMEREDLNLVSDFLVMAATLIDIKSRMLLPKDEDKGEEEGDPREELVARLLEYRKFKWRIWKAWQESTFLNRPLSRRRWPGMSRRWIWTSSLMALPWQSCRPSSAR